uniref:SPRY domain-containing protein n=1 Tax=Meloidogyne hapla TaxID=6305 RepID=A0A1I8C2W1_MELHA
MTEEYSKLNIELKQMMLSQLSDVLELPNKFKNFQNELNKEKDKTTSLEKEIKILKTEMDEEIKELKQNFKQMLDEIKTENTKQIGILKDLINQKDENVCFETKQEQLSVCFQKVPNKWIEIGSDLNCCEKKCTDAKKPRVKCIEGNGFIKLIKNNEIKYIDCLHGCNKPISVYAESVWTKEKECVDYLLYYFEIKCKIQGEKNNDKNWLNIGLESPNKNTITLEVEASTICYNIKNNTKKFKLPTLSWKDEDVFGCGLVYPPTNKMNEELPYVFFTKNGKQIGKAILVEDDFDSYRQYVILKCCSLRAYFGKNHFVYDTTKHFIKEFYEDSDIYVSGILF